MLSQEQTKLVLNNMNLARLIANKYKDVTTSMDYNDLCQSGYRGLILAAKNFDKTLGYTFSTYAYQAIEHNIQDDLRDIDRIIRVPYQIRRHIKDYRKEKKETGISLRQYAEKYNISDKNLLQGIMASRDIISLNEPIIHSNEDYTELMNLITDDKNIETEIFYKDLQNQVNNMFLYLQNIDIPERNINILKDYYGINGKELNYREIGEKYNITYSRAQQIISNLLHKLKYSNRDKKSYLECCEEYDFI